MNKLAVIVQKTRINRIQIALTYGSNVSQQFTILYSIYKINLLHVCHTQTHIHIVSKYFAIEREIKSNKSIEAFSNLSNGQ